MSSKPHLTEVSRIADEEASPTERGIWGLLAELRKRKVCRTAVSYMLVMWLNLQIGDVIFPMIGLPDWSLNLIIIIGIMGFPLVLILAWAFQVTPEGIVLDEHAEPGSRTDRQLDTVVNLLLLISSVILSVLLLLQFCTGERISLLAPVTAVGSQDVVLSNLSFESATEDANSRTIATGVHEELRHRLINLEGIEVLPEAAALKGVGQRRQLALSGSLFLEGGIAHVLAHLVDLSAGRYLMSVAFNLEVGSTLALETAAAERIINEVNRVLSSDHSELASAREILAAAPSGSM